MFRKQIEKNEKSTTYDRFHHYFRTRFKDLKTIRSLVIQINNHLI